MLQTRLGIILSLACNLLYPLDISFNDPFTKIQLWLPIKQEIYDLDEGYQN